jgi:hypothetical protein
MKTNLIRTLMKPLLAVVVVLFLLFGNSLLAQQGKVIQSININKARTSKKYRIKLFPSATHEVLFFNVIGETGKVYQFYLFDTDGNMVKQVQIRNRETTMLANFAKGDYLFEIFSDDERIENGTLSVR